MPAGVATLTLAALVACSSASTTTTGASGHDAGSGTDGGAGSGTDGGASGTDGGASGTDGGAGSGTDGGTATSGTVIPFLPQTLGSSIAVDASGRIHAVGLGTNGNSQLQYSTCASGCATGSSWSSLSFGTTSADDGSASMQVTSDGRPRFTINRISGAIEYFACESGCLSAANWTSGIAVPHTVAKNGPSAGEYRYFAINGSGAAAIVYSTTDGPMLARCASACTVSTNWSRTLIGGPFPTIGDPQLTFTLSGGLAVSTEIDTGAAQLNHAYFECAGSDDCSLAASWKGVQFTPISGHAKTSLAHDNQGRPRLAIFYDNYDAALANALRLWSCDGGCTDPTNWSVISLSGTSNTVDVSALTRRISLAFDAQNHGVLGFRTNETLSVSRCSTDCTTSAAGWTAAPLATSAGLTGALPFAAPCTAAQASWFFEQGDFSVVPLPGGGLAVSADIEAVAKTQTCNDSTNFEFRSLVGVTP